MTSTPYIDEQRVCQKTNKSFFFCLVPPSPELVERVRDLYHKRVPDVRFLIPVINGLEKVKSSQQCRRVTCVMCQRVIGIAFVCLDIFSFVTVSLLKNEVIQALPKLIKLNPIVVKEVFNRLLGTQHSKTHFVFHL